MNHEKSNRDGSYGRYDDSRYSRRVLRRRLGHHRHGRPAAEASELPEGHGSVAQRRRKSPEGFPGSGKEGKRPESSAGIGAEIQRSAEQAAHRAVHAAGKGYSGKIYTIDARKVSKEALGKYFPNTPMLAAIVKVSGIMTDEELLNDMKGSFKHKFAKKPEVIEGNMKALELALKEVKLIQ